MATFLYKLGRLAFRRRIYVALMWVVLLVLSGVGAASASSAGSSFAIPGTEAQKAFDLIDERFPGSSVDGATARIVFEAPKGEKITSPENRATVKKLMDALPAGSDQVGQVPDPYTSNAVSADGSTAYIPVSYKVTSLELTDDTVTSLKDIAADARDTGLTVEIGGDAIQTVPGGGVTESIGIGLAAIVLVITFGSMIAAGLSLLTALIGVGISVSVIAALAGVMDFDPTTSVLAIMIGLAVGIDYALIIVSRHRAEMANGHDPEEAIGRAAGTAGSAVFFAGLTVVIALVGLSVVNIPMLTKMGLAAAGTVTIAVLVALTLVPAAMGFAGRRVLSEKGRAKQLERLSTTGKPNMGARWAQFVLRRPVAVVLVGIVGLGVVAVPAASLEMGLPDNGSQPTSTTQRKAYDMISDAFGPGFNGPLVVVVDTKGSDNAQQTAGQVADAVKNVKDVVAVTPPLFNESGDTAMITAVPKDRPSSIETEDLVHAVRDAGGKVAADNDVRVLVTGQTALNTDFSEKMNDALVPYLAVVVGLAFLLLMLIFRSVLVPLKAAFGFLLSIVAALGAVVAVFQWGWLADVLGVEQTGPIMSMVPIFMVGTVFGLAMDYEVFLVTRMREAYIHGEQPQQAIVSGFRHSARVVTAAAVIMTAVFAVFAVFSGSTQAMIKLIGFSLAVSVLFDAFVVRMAIVPAVLALLGDKAWWLPRWLDRMLPHVDVEGERLRATLDRDAHHSDSGPDAGQDWNRGMAQV
ncbi:MMPL family transporter [Streptomyces sp. NPDC002701]|uniref:MMPL family transporter n=1 Tax=Streptomyces sp. NPDC002701 TaxID=3364661 RepID=UPI00369D11B0